jgi:predicted GTPase
VGYGEEQVRELEKTIANTPCDVVLIGTPIDLRRVMNLDKPAVRVRYDLEEKGPSTLENALRKHFGK